MGYLVYNRKICSVYDRNAVYDRFFFHFAMTHSLKIVHKLIINLEFEHNIRASSLAWLELGLDFYK